MVTKHSNLSISIGFVFSNINAMSHSLMHSAIVSNNDNCQSMSIQFVPSVLHKGHFLRNPVGLSPI